MTKQEFAIKLLFWLFPWPLSMNLPDKYRSLCRTQITPSLPPIYYSWPAPDWWDPAWGNFWEFIAGLIPDIPYWWPGSAADWIEFILFPPTEQPPWWPIDAPPFTDFIGDLPTTPPPWWPPGTGWPPSSDIIPPHPPGPAPIFDPYLPGPGLPGGPYTPQPSGPAYAWYQKLDTTYWRPVHPASWDAANQRWVIPPAGGGVGILYTCIGCTWQSGYRPTHVKITHTDPTNPQMRIYDTDGVEICDISSYASGTAATLTFRGYDINWLELWSSSCYITNIRFRGVR